MLVVFFIGHTVYEVRSRENILGSKRGSQQKTVWEPLVHPIHCYTPTLYQTANVKLLSSLLTPTLHAQYRLTNYTACPTLPSTSVYVTKTCFYVYITLNIPHAVASILKESHRIELPVQFGEVESSQSA